MASSFEERVGDLVKAAVVLAIVRHGLRVSGGGPDDAHREEIAIDTWNAVRGVNTCVGEPMPELVTVLRGGG